MADRTTSLENVERALAELEDYAALPITHRRDKAGLLADEILGRILDAYLPCFRATLARARAATDA